AAVDAAGRVADEPLRPRPLVVPDFTAGAGIERVALVGAGDVHDAAGNDRRDLQARSARDAEDPLGNDPSRVARVDLRERTITAAAGLPVVAGPVCLRRHRPE